MALTSKPCCSFCGKDQKSVGKLIAGQNDVLICNECIDICNQVLDASATKTKKPEFEIVEQKMFCAVLQNYEEQTIMDMVSWLNENNINTWKHQEVIGEADTFKILFENESDLVAFKLRWI